MPPSHAESALHHELMQAALQAAQSIKPRVREIELNRCLPQDIAEQLAQAGLYRMLTPRCYGGHEAHVVTFFEVVETLARHEAASAWCSFISNTACLVAAYLPAEVAAPLFAPTKLKAAGVLAPRGKAVRETQDGVAGYRISGRWFWGSGAHNADIVIGGCLVFGADGRLEIADGSTTPTLLTAVFERAQVLPLNNWDSMGLCGTGSGEFEVQGVFVPAARCAQLAGGALLPGPLYRFPVFGMLAIGIAAVAAGIAREAIGAFITLATEKVPQASSRTLAQRPAAQEAVARAEATLRGARAFLLEAIHAAWANADAGNEIPLEQRRDIRLAATHATHACAQVVDRLYTLAGGSAVFTDSPLQRCLRNVHVATQHMMVAEATFELTGRLLLGLPTDAALL